MQSGDTVFLIPDNRKVTVRKIISLEQSAICVWFDSDGFRQEARFPLENLSRRAVKAKTDLKEPTQDPPPKAEANGKEAAPVAEQAPNLEAAIGPPGAQAAKKRRPAREEPEKPASTGADVPPVAPSHGAVLAEGENREAEDALAPAPHFQRHPQSIPFLIQENREAFLQARRLLNEMRETLSRSQHRPDPAVLYWEAPHPSPRPTDPEKR